MKSSLFTPLFTFSTARVTSRQAPRLRASAGIIHNAKFSTTPHRRTESQQSASHVGSANRLPEFNLEGKVVCISGAGRGLGLVQAEALLEAGAIGNYLPQIPFPKTQIERYQTD